MNNYKVSWIDIHNNEWFSDDMDIYNATKLYNEICNDKVDNEQIEARLLGENDIILKRFNNIKNEYYLC